MEPHKKLQNNPDNDIEHSGPVCQPVLQDPIPHEILVAGV